MSISRLLTTCEFSEQVYVGQETIRVRVKKHGSFHGVVPDKLQNGRLIWPSDWFNFMSKEYLLKWYQKRGYSKGQLKEYGL